MNDFKTRIEKFLDSINGQTSEAYYININRFFNNQLYPYCVKINKTVENFTIEDVVDFMSQSELALKIRSFENNFVYIRKYLRWCADNGYVSPQLLETHFAFIPGIISNIFHGEEYAKAIQSSKYFISTDEFVRFIDTVFGEELSLQVDFIKDVSRFDSQKAILYLLWLGFSAEQIISLTNEDFDIKNRTIAGVKITNKDIFSFFCYYKPRTSLLQLRKKGEEYPAEYRDTYHLVKGIYNECSLITVRNATFTAQKRQKMLPADSPFRHLKVNVSTIFYSQLFEKCYLAEYRLLNSDMKPSSKTLESYIKDIIKANMPDANDTDVAKAYKEYNLYKSMINL